MCNKCGTFTSFDDNKHDTQTWSTNACVCVRKSLVLQAIEIRIVVFLRSYSFKNWINNHVVWLNLSNRLQTKHKRTLARIHITHKLSIDSCAPTFISEFIASECNFNFYLSPCFKFSKRNSLSAQNKSGKYWIYTHSKLIPPLLRTV